jgi:uncharacterized protein (DUF1778 family)
MMKNRRVTMSEAAAPVERPAERNRRDAIINLRVPRQIRDLFDAAANVLGKTRTEFVVDSARKCAIDVLLDQRFFELNEKEWTVFAAILDNPPKPNEKLKRLMSKKAPWDK